MLRTNEVLAILLATVLALFSFGTFKVYAADISAPGWFKATVTGRTSNTGDLDRDKINFTFSWESVDGVDGYSVYSYYPKS